MKSKPRMSNFELLRIIAMFMIVLHHSIVHGVLGEFFPQNSFNLYSNHPVVFFVARLFAFGGKTGVALFILITGYFSINSKMKWSRILKVWVPTLFYSILCYILFKLFGPSLTDKRQVLASFFPVTFRSYWFITLFIMLLFAIPALNTLWHHCSRKQQGYIIISLFVTYILLPTLGLYADNSLFFIFIMYYLIGGYIRGTPKVSFWNKKTVYIVGILLSLTGYAYLTFHGIRAGYLAHSSDMINATTKFFGDNNICVVVFAVSFFMFFNHISLRPNRLINLVASSTFGIYLIHDNPFVRKFIWFDLLHFEKLATTNLINFVVIDLITVLIIFGICSTIEIIRNKLFNLCGFSKLLQNRFNDFNLF
ncbi:acyltransferase [Ligilactobacillus acidipiscis]|uniref:Acyltransferase 3 domain-containing protein n=1 Tax=Ligilactobacillus acidipiscis TaxID=89059 RepID=A0A1K1KR50_9LACO|nr:acyltransferase family protein [Ligilactobacillus acidipiscis]SFV41401.1 hypothetical protein LAC1533_1978 [Ligilactobacillus acidipiscis]